MTPLRLRMIEDMQIRNLAPLTQSCLHRAGLPVRPPFRPDRLSGLVRRRSGAYRLYLAQDKHLAASSISVAVAALRFLYTVTLKRAWTVEDDIPTAGSLRSSPRC